MASSQASGVNTPPYVDFKRAVELMLDGHPVIFPTETFFALGSRALDADATARVYRAKHRSTVRPLPLILGDWEQLDMIAKVHDELMPLLKRFWPGPLSVICRTSANFLKSSAESFLANAGRVAVRLSSHPVARALAQAVGEPITSSSANISGNPAVVSVNQLDEELIASVMGILDEPPVPAGGLPSTLVERMEDGRLRLLRAGAVTSAQIAEAGFEVVEEE